MKNNLFSVLAIAVLLFAGCNDTEGFLKDGGSEYSLSDGFGDGGGKGGENGDGDQESQPGVITAENGMI
jgi:predicted small secreted protein